MTGFATDRTENKTIHCIGVAMQNGKRSALFLELVYLRQPIDQKGQSVVRRLIFR